MNQSDMQSEAVGAQKQQTDPGLWLTWLYATVGGAFMGVVLIGIVMLGLPSSAFPGFLPRAQTAVTIIALFLGLGMGVAQGLTLQHLLSARIWWQWALLTGVAAAGAGVVIAIGWPFAERLFDDTGSLVALFVLPGASAALAGLIVGSTQWLILHHYVRQAAWWIAASAIAIPLGGIIGLLAVFVVGQSSGSGDYLPSGAMYILIMIGACAPWPVIGTITGLVLARLLRKPKVSELNLER